MPNIAELEILKKLLISIQTEFDKFAELYTELNTAKQSCKMSD